MDECVKLLTTATTAIRDLQAGYRNEDIIAPSGRGVNALLRDLVTYLRGNGVDDEGAWDCDATEGIAVRKTPDFEPFTLVVDAFDLTESGEGPEYAEFTVTPDFIERLLRLYRLCEEHELDCVSIRDAARWARVDKLRISGDFLQVFGSFFYLEAYSRALDCEVRTSDIDIASLVSVAGLATEGTGFRRVGSKVFYSEYSVDNLIALYEREGATCAECGAQVEEVIGCPDGAEICQQCFDQGSH